MKISLLSLSLAFASALLGGCAAQPADDGAVSDESNFTGLEHVGSIEDGETQTITRGPTSAYRALALYAEAGDTLQVRVQAFGKDAELSILDEHDTTLLHVDDTRDGEDEVLTYVVPATGGLQIAFRETHGRAGDFIVSLRNAKAVAPGVPQCTGAPHFPASGSRGTLNAVRIELQAACSDCGFVEVGRKTFQWSPIRVDATRNVTVDATLLQEAIPDAGEIYDCTTVDTGSASLDANGSGTSSMHVSRRCNVRGGSGGPSSENGFRPGHVTLGDGCITIVDDDRGSSVHRIVYSAKY